MNTKSKDPFKGKDEIICSYIPKFPVAAEREYFRLTNEYMRLLKESVEECMPELATVLRREFVTDSKESEAEVKKKRAAGFASAAPAIEEVFRKITQVLEQRLSLFDIRRRMNLIAGATRKLTIKEWKKAISKAIGIDIFEDYYMGDFFQKEIEKWISDNVDLIRSIPKDALGEMKQMVYEGYVNGRSVTAISKDIQKHYQVNKRKARLIARDQMGKLSADITKAQQMDAGIREYQWRTCGDSRVRESHKKLDKKIFSWDNPPVVDEKTGRRCHPGQDYQCRCIAVAVLRRDNIHLPI